MPTQYINIVDEAFRAFNAPIESQTKQADLAIKKQEIVANQLSLNNQMAFQQDMGKIWGPGGVSSAQANAENPDYSDPSLNKKFMATAMDAFSRGMPQAGGQMLSSLQMMNFRQSEVQKNHMATIKAQSGIVGSALGAVKDQASEEAAISALQAEGIDPATLGLTGDWTSDQHKIPVLAQAAMTRAQQLSAQDREASYAGLQSQRAFMDAIAQARLGQGAQRIQIDLNREDLSVERESRLQQEADRRDARAQEALRVRDARSSLKVYPDELKDAVTTFKVDPRTSAMPADLQMKYADIAARRAKQKIAKQIQSDQTPDDFNTVLNDEILKLDRQGAFKPDKAGGWFSDPTYTYKPPKSIEADLPPPLDATAHAVVKPPLPKTPAGIPEGSRRIGNTPDGKPVWQDATGKKWVE